MICLLSLVHGKEIGRSKFKSKDNGVFNVIDYRAVGDGQTDDTAAFEKAWKAMCNTRGDAPTLVVPKEKTFLVHSVAFNGPCKSGNPHVQIDGIIMAPAKSDWTGHFDRWIQFVNVQGLVINGSGRLDGQGSTWWDHREKRQPKPTALTLAHCDGCRLSGLTHVNSQRNHIQIATCNDVIISHINISAPGDSHNTDGVDISRSTNIRLENSFIGTGDDCVAINDGCKFINITNVACGPGHGISIGSLGGDSESFQTVEEVHVRNCNITDSMNGARIKTWQGGKGSARNISFEQLTLVNVDHPIIIDQRYYVYGSTANEGSAIEISGVTFSGIQGTTSRERAIILDCSPFAPCANIFMNDVNIQSTEPGAEIESYCVNAHVTSTETFPKISCQ
ncbi:hypothetical protein MKW94_030968 [Papaver nudicaule]|uniref:Polygalacturonase n=1 Tax=Papaver nudicaule TaxID=74823 RepID=A0AA41SCG6_PAPNU|nr:hypothetical protein [Papaver nudicaule]